MKKILILSALALASCSKKSSAPTPATAPSEAPPAPLVVPFTFSGYAGLRLAVRDSATGQYFRPVMTGYVHFYPPQWTEAEVRTQAVFDKRVGWLLAPTQYSQQATIGPGYIWDADNTILLAVLGKANAVILWQFVEGDRARPRYSQQYQYLGVLSGENRVDLVINKKLAGL